MRPDQTVTSNPRNRWKFHVIDTLTASVYQECDIHLRVPSALTTKSDPSELIKALLYPQVYHEKSLVDAHVVVVEIHCSAQRSTHCTSQQLKTC